MKCEVQDCYDDATVHVIEVKDNKLLGRKSTCEAHKWDIKPFSDPDRGVTSLGAGLRGGTYAYELRYIMFFHERQSDSLVLDEVRGTKRFGLPVLRIQSNVIVQALQKTGEKDSRPFTFTAFAIILQANGVKVDAVVVDQIEGEGLYYHAKVKLSREGRSIEVDIRPSDAFGLAVACESPIFISDNVLERAAELGWTKPPSSGA